MLLTQRDTFFLLFRGRIFHSVREERQIRVTRRKISDIVCREVVFFLY